MDEYNYWDYLTDEAKETMESLKDQMFQTENGEEKVEILESELNGFCENYGDISGKNSLQLIPGSNDNNRESLSFLILDKDDKDVASFTVGKNQIEFTQSEHYAIKSKNIEEVEKDVEKVTGEKNAFGDSHEDLQKQKEELIKELSQLHAERTKLLSQAKREGITDELRKKIDQKDNEIEKVGKKAGKTIDEIAKQNKEMRQQKVQEIKTLLKLKISVAVQHLKSTNKSLQNGIEKFKQGNKNIWNDIAEIYKDNYRNTLVKFYALNSKILDIKNKEYERIENRYLRQSEFKSKIANVGRAVENFKNTISGKELNTERIVVPMTERQINRLDRKMDFIDDLEAENKAIEKEFNMSRDHSIDIIKKNIDKSKEMGVKANVEGLDSTLEKLRKQDIQKQAKEYNEAKDARNPFKANKGTDGPGSDR